MTDQQPLLQEITAFCRLLKQMGVNVTTTNQISFCRSVELINIGQQQDFYDAAKMNLIANESDRALFDVAFDWFWRYPRPDPQELGLDTDEEQVTSLEDLLNTEETVVNLDQWTEMEDDKEEGEEDTIAYSAERVLTQKDFGQFTAEEMQKAQEVIAKLVPLLATKLSRRKKTSTKGKTIDFRQSWRKNIAYGGEPLKLIRKRQKIKKNKILLLCDVSGSMDYYSTFLIQFVYGMQQALKEVEVAVFSTELTNITGLLRRKGLEEGLREVAQVVPDWSGGTRIGESIVAFNREFGRSFSAYRTVVILISDGWDRGEADILQKGMEVLHRQAYKLIWLNPLLGSEGYQPICRGIRTALPYVDYFLPAHNLDSLIQLTKVLTPIWSD